MTPRTKKIALIGGGLGALLLVIALLPLVFRGPIEARVRAEIEQATRVRVSWSDVGLTFFRDFPHPTFSLHDLTVIGTGRFDGDTLAAVGTFRAAFGVGSVVRAVTGSGPLVVRSVRIDRPVLNLTVDDDGTASWDVVPSRGDGGGDEGSGRSLAVALRSFELTDGRIVLQNERSGLFASVEGLRHSLSGNFSRETLVASTELHADRTTLQFAGTPYLAGVSLDFDADFDVDMSGPRFRLLDNQLRLNDLVLGVEGEVARQGEDLVLGLSFEAPSTQFAQLLSLVPVVYQRDFASLQTSGSFSLAGFVRGVYGESAFPALALDVRVENGSFKYPDLPLPARAITADLSITNPGGDIDSTVIRLSRFHVEIGDQPIDAAVTLRTPVSDPEADVRVHGTLDLGAVARTVNLDNTVGLAGVIVADAAARARRSDVDSARYERITAQGSIVATDVTLRSDALRQPIDVEEMRIELSPQRAALRSLRAQLGSSDLQATGQIDNLLAFVLGWAPLRGQGTMTSRRFVLDEWRSDDDIRAIAVPAMLDLTLDARIDQLAFDALEMTNARGRAIVRDQRLTFERFALQTLGGRIGMDGWYETLDPTRPTFALDLALDSLDIAGAAAAFLTVRTLAPVAQHARGTFSSALDLRGALGEDMAPVFDVLDGRGTLATSRVSIEGFPMLDRLSDALQLSRLSNPTVEALRSSIRIQNGRLHVDPFQVGVAGLAMTVAGSSGIDRSVDYTLGLLVPRAGFADAALQGLATRAGPLGASLAAVDPVRIGVRVTGTVDQPALNVGLGDTAGSLGTAAAQAAGGAVQQRVDEAQQRLDAEREEARARARAQADSLVADAEARAEAIRAEARRLAAEVRAEGNRAADELLARATNPLARTAAEPAAERLRREANERAAGIEREADERASALVAETRIRADALVGTN
jgi:hypothetical protein